MVCQSTCAGIREVDGALERHLYTQFRCVKTIAGHRYSIVTMSNVHNALDISGDGIKSKETNKNKKRGLAYTWRDEDDV